MANYECLSRCCHTDTCSHFKYCVQSCSTNTECQSGCCSLGYCSSPNMCDGRKDEGDTCMRSSECQSGQCYFEKRKRKKTTTALDT